MAGSYVKVGRGDHHVIALHGWFGSALGWGHLTDYLNTAQFTYVFPDLRGYGSRRDEPGDFTMAEAGADAIALADALGFDAAIGAVRDIWDVTPLEMIGSEVIPAVADF